MDGINRQIEAYATAPEATLREIRKAQDRVNRRMAAIHAGKSVSKTYQPNGARECARRLKQAARKAT